MAGRGQQDLDAANLFHYGQHAVNQEEHMDFSLHGRSASQIDFDLNSQGDEFPHLSTYQELLQGRGTQAAVLPSAGRGRGGKSSRGGMSKRASPTGEAASNARAPFRAPTSFRARMRSARGASLSAAAVRASAISTADDDTGTPREPTFTAESDAFEDETQDDEEENLKKYASSEEEDGIPELAMHHMRAKKRQCIIACMIGTYYYEFYMNKAPPRKIEERGYDWVIRTLNDPEDCFDMFRMNKTLFHRLHDLLVSSYGLKTSNKMCSVEALGMFLWIVGAPQSVRQAKNHFGRSKETVSRKFDEVLQSVLRLSVDIIKPTDPEFRIVHPRLQGPRFSPLFDNCIGAIDGTHIRVVVPASKVVQYVGRHGNTTQNVLAIWDFDMRYTFVVAGWPGSVHDMRVFNDALQKYRHKFPSPPQGKFYLVDSGYSNRLGYLAPYKGTKYHLPEYRQGPRPRGRKEVFNYAHSSLRNVIERSFGVLKMKWRILLHLPSYSELKQSQIILACMALHNYIRESKVADADFDKFDSDENYMPPSDTSSAQESDLNNQLGDEDDDMNAIRDNIADSLIAMRR